MVNRMVNGVEMMMIMRMTIVKIMVISIVCACTRVEMGQGEK